VILIAYYGSEGSKGAIAGTGKLLAASRWCWEASRALCSTTPTGP
jgi:hypothetical protein